MDLHNFLDFVYEAKDIFLKKYRLLSYISEKSTVGRRNITKDLNLSERFVRDTVDFLRDKGLCEVTSRGISITDLGIKYVEDFEDLFLDLTSNSSEEGLAQSVKKATGLKNIFISDSNGKDELAKYAAKIIRNYIHYGFHIGVTGGETVSKVIDNIETDKKNLKIVPARGSIGIKSEFQANTVAIKFAQKTGSESYIVPVPDFANKDLLTSFEDSSEYKELLDKFKSIDLLIFGIGRADIMAKRRGLDEEVTKKILSDGAVGEAFGNYFSATGGIVYKKKSLGLSLSDYKNIGSVIAVASGEEKADATLAICSLRKDLTLIIDRELANEIIRRN